jgi:hypothetical protein
MSQLLTLVWLKWTLLKNSLRSSKAVVNQVATLLGMLLALAVSLVVAIGLAFASYAINRPGFLSAAVRHGAASGTQASMSPELIFFSILAFVYLMWATLPLSIGSSKQFDAGKLLMYPISLRKLFAIDFVSEITTLQSVVAIPAILAMCVGAGLGSGRLAPSLLAFVPASVFGIALSKCLSMMIGTLVRRKRARGETIIALVGALAALGGSLAGQVAPMLFRHAESLQFLRWTPPGAAALVIIGKTEDQLTYLAALATLCSCSIALIFLTYWIARRSALGLGGRRRQRVIIESTVNSTSYTGWQLPLLSPQLSAVVEKEMRYALRNAQLRMLALMPMVLIFIRFINSRRFSGDLSRGVSPAAKSFLTFGPGLMATFGILYVFLILTGLACNLFAFEEGGMRTLVLAPIPRRKILVGKNIVVIVIALVLSSLLLLINGVVFRDLTPLALLFACLSFVIFAGLMSVIGNWLSIRFPKRMQYGKRMNLSGIAALISLPFVFTLALIPLLAILIGWYSRSLLIEYATLATFAVASVGFYFLMIGFQGRTLERREIEILEAVREPSDE